MVVDYDYWQLFGCAGAWIRQLTATSQIQMKWYQ